MWIPLKHTICGHQVMITQNRDPTKRDGTFIVYCMDQEGKLTQVENIEELEQMDWEWRD